MAESFSDIMSDYENKSIEELGSSLLARQQQIQKDRAKEAKKSRRVGQALALLGVGQKIFKNAYDKRMAELDKRELFLLSDNAFKIDFADNIETSLSLDVPPYSTQILIYPSTNPLNKLLVPNLNIFLQQKYQLESPLLPLVLEEYEHIHLQ